MAKFKYSVLLLLFSFIIFNEISNANAEVIHFSDAQILISKKIKSPQKETCVKVLKEEIKKRTNIDLAVSGKWSSEKVNIALCISTDKKLSGKLVPQNKDMKYTERRPEGFRLVYEEKDNRKTIWIIGTDQRGVLFGVGELLRRLRMSDSQIKLNIPLNFASAPVYAIRGHQLGYRNTANSYDAWSVQQYEQYIRDLVVFGGNAIENIPLGGKSDESKLMKLSREKMNVEISEICQAYNVDYWVWIPVQFDLKEKKLRESELEKHDAFYKACPRLDNVFIPGGDPGDNHPREMLPFIKDLHKRLVKYHPKAGLWLSLQGFSEEQVDYFYKYLEENKPKWLRGVVSGPGSPAVSETRFRLPKQYKQRFYPDITHNVRCQFPAPDFDQAFALTIGREGINPMPVYYAKIFREYSPFTDGFVAYSDGCHDDINKIIWNQLGWNPDKDILDILTEYSRYFFNPSVEKAAAEGILALEKNWLGPLKENGSVEAAFKFWKDLENNNPQLSANWRWQMLVLRASYDTYVRRRLINEKKLEKQANRILAEVNELGIDAAMREALKTIKHAKIKPIEKDLRNNISEYCQSLYKLIGLQSSVKKYGASGSERAAILDYVDHPLNNRWWYEDEFKKIEKMNTEKEKIERLETIRTWENPGEGSFYDDVSNIANSPHVLSTVEDATDFAWWDKGFSRMRLSTQVYQYEPILKYENLDPNARYLIRVSGYGDALIRVDGQRLEPVLYNKDFETFKEFVCVADKKVAIMDFL